MTENNKRPTTRLPRWLKMQMPQGTKYSQVKNIVHKNQLHTICTSGKCPNIGECWNSGTATFMILGEICTRNCKFCGVQTGKPLAPNHQEPMEIAQSIQQMKLKHAVITSVDRDDLSDLGAQFWVNTIETVKQLNPNVKLEVLIPDFQGYVPFLRKIISAGPEVISHNLETVKRLSPQIRSVATYEQSLNLLKIVAENHVIAKSGIMLGLGETKEEIIQTMDDLRSIDCKVLTIGQYLAPSPKHVEVKRYISPDEFEEYKIIGLKKGFSFVESSPLVRSSYHAEQHCNA